MDILIVLLIGIGLVGLGVLALFFGMRTFTVNEVTDRLNLLFVALISLVRFGPGCLSRPFNE
jgi:hypothetical protein